MFKILLFILTLGGLAYGFSSLAESKGALQLQFNSTLYELSLPIAVLGFLLVLLVIFVIIAVFKIIFRSPRAALHMAKERKKRKGYEALTQGLLSISAGDYTQAQKNAKEAKKYAPEDPLTLLLAAQSSQFTQDRQGAEMAFRQMLEAPQTKLIGLRGLYLEAERKGEAEHARQICEDAIKLTPSTPWAAQGLLKLEVKAKDYDAALRTIERNLTARVIDKAQARRLRAVLLTAKGGLDFAQEALSYAPDLIPALVQAMQGAMQTDPRKAQKLAEQSWKKEPHPEVANAFKSLITSESAAERLKKCENLAKFNPTHRESALLIAKAALEAAQFSRAREVLTAHLSTLTPRLCLALAELETMETQNYGKAREWTQKALVSSPDEGWLCEGVLYDKWQAASPQTGELDAFTWGQPLAQHQPLVIEMPSQERVSPLPLALETTVVEAQSETKAPGKDTPKELWQETVFALNQLPDDPGLKQPPKKKSWF
jgi:HemY protein